MGEEVKGSRAFLVPADVTSKTKDSRQKKTQTTHILVQIQVMFGRRGCWGRTNEGKILGLALDQEKKSPRRKRKSRKKKNDYPSFKIWQQCNRLSVMNLSCFVHVIPVVLLISFENI